MEPGPLTPPPDLPVDGLSVEGLPADVDRLIEGAPSVVVVPAGFADAGPISNVDLARADEAVEEEVESAPLLDISAWVRDAPPWLASAALHLLALIVLGLLFGGVSFEQPLSLEASYSDEEGVQLIDDTLDLDDTAEIEIDSALSPSLLPEAVNPLATPPLLPISPLGSTLSSDQPSPTIGVALRGRSEALKRVLLKSFGGTASTERAVLEGLKWLQRNQRRNGLWSLSGPYRDGSNAENQQAATAMALLAFQGAGHTHQLPPDKPFAKTVAKGWAALLKLQKENGSFSGPDNYNQAFYTHAQATIALCELYAMTQDEALLDPAQRAIDYLIRTQSSNGGWRYEAGQGGDLSVTGWVVMALQSARIAGLIVPSKTFFDVRRFIDSCQSDGGARYGYLPRAGAQLSMTAEGLLCRQYMGWKQDDSRLRRGAYYLLDNLPSVKRGKRDVYYWYYATQVLHHMEGEFWDDWNRVMRDILPRQQEAKGRETGSWAPTIDEHHGRSGGRLYTTCLSIYILEVYYRHLPIYQQELIGGL